MSLACDNGGLFCTPFEGSVTSCLGSGSDVCQRPYHRNCTCNLHNDPNSRALRRSTSRVSMHTMSPSPSSRQGPDDGDPHVQQQQPSVVMKRALKRTASFSDLSILSTSGRSLHRSSSSFSNLASLSSALLVDHSDNLLSIFDTGSFEDMDIPFPMYVGFEDTRDGASMP